MESHYGSAFVESFPFGCSAEKSSPFIIRLRIIHFLFAFECAYKINIRTQLLLMCISHIHLEHMKNVKIIVYGCVNVERTFVC